MIWVNRVQRKLE